MSPWCFSLLVLGLRAVGAWRTAAGCAVDLVWYAKSNTFDLPPQATTVAAQTAERAACAA